jgi:hypothetical protein
MRFSQTPVHAHIRPYIFIPPFFQQALDFIKVLNVPRYEKREKR